MAEYKDKKTGDIVNAECWFGQHPLVTVDEYNPTIGWLDGQTCYVDYGDWIVSNGSETWIEQSIMFRAGYVSVNNLAKEQTNA